MSEQKFVYQLIKVEDGGRSQPVTGTISQMEGVIWNVPDKDNYMMLVLYSVQEDNQINWSTFPVMHLSTFLKAGKTVEQIAEIDARLEREALLAMEEIVSELEESEVFNKLSNKA